MNRVAWPGRDSGWWLVAVGVAFTAAELLFVPPRMGLSLDEVVYVSQVSGHAPAARVGRDRGAGRARRAAGPAGPPAAIVGRHMARLSHLWHQRSQGQRIYRMTR
jgi:hypothetical protein